MKKADKRKRKNGKTTIFQVYSSADHFIAYDLKTKQGKIDVEVSSLNGKRTLGRKHIIMSLELIHGNIQKTGISLWQNIIRLDMMDRI